MGSPDLVPLRDVAWPALNHRAARFRLEQLGWVLWETGDWAWVLRSPGRDLVARISPFEPAYQLFVGLCARLAGNPYLPTVHLGSDLEGGGHLAVLAYLDPATEQQCGAFRGRWQDPGTSDLDLAAIRTAIEEVDAAARRGVRWWGGLDLKDEHLRSSPAGQVVLIDTFYVAGGSLTGAAIDDHAEFSRIMPASRRRYLLDLPALGEDYLADTRRRLEAVFPEHERPGTTTVGAEGE